MTVQKQLTEDQYQALRLHAALHGRCWKSKLLLDWQRDHPNCIPILQEIRNQFGPAWLRTFKLKKKESN